MMKEKTIQKMIKLGWINTAGQPLEWSYWQRVYDTDKYYLQEKYL